MAVQEYYTSIDVRGNEIKNVVVDVMTAEPTTDSYQKAGRIVSYLGDLYISNGTNFSKLGKASEIATLRTDVNGLKTTVGDAGSGLVKEVADIKKALGGGEEGGDASLTTLVAGLRTDLGNKGDEAAADGSAFARIAKNKADISANTASISGLDTAVKKAQNDATTANTTANANKTDIASIKEKDTAQDGRLDALESTVGKAAAGEVAATGLVKGVADNKSAIAALTTTVEDNKTNLEVAIGTKVDKVEGKQLSTNDYTTEEKTKLAGIKAGAQVNKIEVVKVDGTALAIAADDKSVNIDLSGYAKKTDISSAYKAMGSKKFAELPAGLGADNKGEVYNVTDAFKDGDKVYPAGTNVLWTGTEWDPLAGLTDLSAYAKTETVTAELAKKQNNLSTEQLAAVDSGITATKVGTYDGYSDLITAAQNAADAAQTAADGKVVKNADIVAGTACKITYDKKGLVTKGEALAAADIPTIGVEKVSGVLPVDQTPIMAVTKDVSATAGTAVAIASGMTTALIAQVFDGDGKVVLCQTAITGGTVSLTFSEAFTGKVHIVGLR